VEWTLEEPPGGGPVAALATGLASATTDIVVVLGADLPTIDPDAVDVLASAMEDAGADAAIGVDDSARDQYLCAVYRTDRLRARLQEIDAPAGVSMRTLVEPLTVSRLPLGSKVADIDTPEDLTRFSQ
jgi:molybdopterin-guanine dinucleotide biosynthesis protein A